MAIEASGLSQPLSGMDRVRARPSRRGAWAIGASALAIGSVLVLAFLPRAVPSVERSALVIDTATRGIFVREIAAAGTLVAEQSRLIVAPAAGRVEAVHVDSGQDVTAGDLLVTLANRETIKELLEIEQQLSVAEADLADLSATLQARSLENESLIRKVEFERRDAARQSEATAQLAREGLISNLEALRAREASEEAAGRAASEQQRHRALAQSANAQLAAQRDRIERLRALRAFQQAIVESLAVRTPVDGAIREVLVQDGEWVGEGQRMFRLVERGRLEALLQVPEAAAREVKAGQRVIMNARGTTLTGEVKRVAPAVEQGTVAVEVDLNDPLPNGLRPDLSLEGRVEITRQADVLTVARPSNATPNATGYLYRLDSKNVARRIPVRYGADSVDRIVVAAGARAGDRLVIAGLDQRTEAAIKVKPGGQ